MRQIFKGSTGHSEYVALVDSTTGLPKTGIADTSVTGSYVRTRTARTAITMSALGSVSASFSSGGWFEVDATNQPGLYRVDVPDAAFASGVDQVYLTIKATGCKTEHKEFRLIDWNNQVAALPNVAAGANGGLPTGNASGQVTIAGTATGAIVAASFAAGAIDNAAIATDAIGSAELAASAVTEIQSGLSTLDAAGVRTAVGLASASLDTQIAALQSDTDNIQTRLPAALVSGRMDSSVGAMAADVLTASAIATDAIGANEIATSAITEIQSGLSTLDASGVRGAVGLGSANLDTQLSTIAGYVDTEVAAILAAVDTEVAAIKAKTDLIPASPAAVGDIPTATENADALLKRDWTAVTGEASRSVLNALRFLRNKWSISGTTLTVTKENDTTAAFTAALTTDGAATPVTGSDPT